MPAIGDDNILWYLSLAIWGPFDIIGFIGLCMGPSLGQALGKSNLFPLALGNKLGTFWGGGTLSGWVGWVMGTGCIDCRNLLGFWNPPRGGGLR